jgi:5-(hydroxymethyl)furfural/furfural oxidase
MNTTWTEAIGAQPYDAIVAGGGAAGCVLAGRLSEASDRRVLLIEAGPDAPAQKEHRDIRDPFPVSWSNPRFAWSGLTAESRADSGDGKPPISSAYLQGYGLGGGSNINGMGADRGQPGDYDEWRDLGADGWGWNDVLPYFRLLERDIDFSGPLHGSDGPMPIRRVRASEWAPFARAISQAVQRRGYPQIDDYNAAFRDGVSAFPMNCTIAQRVSASMAYLPAAVRRRKNLTILTDTTVERLTITEHRVVGVVVRSSGTAVELKARETLIACGALQSPTLLMRSGVGPAEKLLGFGIPIVADLAGVGRNLQNHPVLMVAVHLQRRAVQARNNRSLLQNIVRFSSKHSGCADHDMLLYPFNRASWHPLGRRVGALVLYVNKPYSLGDVDLTGPERNAPPRIRFNLLSDPRDLGRMISGLRFALELLTDPEVERTRNEVFVPNGTIAARLERRSWLNGIQAWSAARALDVTSLRQHLLRHETVDVTNVTSGNNTLEQFVRKNAHAAYHVCGTCRMGRANDPAAVVDSAGRVHGVAGLRVADASIFPTVPRANTHLTVLMTAEKLASRVKADWRT